MKVRHHAKKLSLDWNDHRTGYDPGAAPTRNANVTSIPHVRTQSFPLQSILPQLICPELKRPQANLLTTQSPQLFRPQLTYPKLQSPSLRSRSEYQISSTILLLFSVPRWSLLQSILTHAAFGVKDKDVAHPDQLPDCTAPAHHHINLAISSPIPGQRYPATQYPQASTRLLYHQDS